LTELWTNMKPISSWDTSDHFPRSDNSSPLRSLSRWWRAFGGGMAKAAIRIPEVLPTSPISLVCPFRKAKPGDDCLTTSGGFSAVHIARVKAAAVIDNDRIISTAVADSRQPNSSKSSVPAEGGLARYARCLPHSCDKVSMSLCLFTIDSAHPSGLRAQESETRKF
jgi:hypothetical protein